MSQTEKFHFKEFTNLDKSADADFLVHSMDVMSSLESIKAIKQRALETLNLQPGDSALEVGCGHGEDAERMGMLVGDTGHVLAIDNSRRMLAEASRRSSCSNVEYRLADVQNIPCSTDTFSACHADRLLVGHENFADIFLELLRVLKPGGRISITDVDALTIAIYPYNERTAAILAQIQSSFVNPFIGRQLLSLFSKNGLQNIKLLPEISTIRGFDTLSKIFKFSDIAREAAKNGRMSQEEAIRWQTEMLAADQRGEFLYSIMFFTVFGEKPR